MTLLFSILVLLGFIAMLAAHLQPARLPQWPAWALWTGAAFIWFIPRLSGS